MASENKKKKLKNSYQVPGGLKAKHNSAVKRISFFTAALRKQEKIELEKLKQ